MCQSGEMAHKAHCKEACFSTNRKDWEVQIMSVHARKDALVFHRKQMTGEPRNSCYEMKIVVLVLIATVCRRDSADARGCYRISSVDRFQRTQAIQAGHNSSTSGAVTGDKVRTREVLDE